MMSEEFDRLLSELCSTTLCDGGECGYREERLCVGIEDAYRAAADRGDPPDMGQYLEYLISTLSAQSGKCGGALCARTFARFFKGVGASWRGAQRGAQGGAQAAQGVRESVSGRLLEVIRFEDYPAAAKRLAWVAVREAFRCAALTEKGAFCEAAAANGCRSKYSAVRVAAVRALGVLVPPLPAEGRVTAALGEALEGVLCGWGARSERLAALELLSTRGPGALLLGACRGLREAVAERVTHDLDPEVRARGYRVALGCFGGPGGLLERVGLCKLVSCGLAEGDPGVRKAFLEGVLQRWCRRKGCVGAERFVPVCAALVPACSMGDDDDDNNNDDENGVLVDVEDPLAENLCCRLVCELLRSQAMLNPDALEAFHGTCGLFTGNGKGGGRCSYDMRCVALVWRAFVAEVPQLEWPFTLGELAEALGSGSAGGAAGAGQDPFVARQLLLGTRGLTFQYDVAGSVALERVLVALLSTHRTSRSLIPHLLSALRTVVPDEGDDNDDEDINENDNDGNDGSPDEFLTRGGREGIYRVGVGILHGIQRSLNDPSSGTPEALSQALSRVSRERAFCARTLSAHLWDDGSSASSPCYAARALTDAREHDMELALLGGAGGAGGAAKWRRLDLFLRWIGVFRGFAALFGVHLLSQGLIETCFTSTAYPALKAAAFEALALLQLSRGMSPALVAALFPRVLAQDPSPLLRATAARALFDYAAAAPGLRGSILASLGAVFAFDMAGRWDGSVEQRARAEVYLAFVEGYARLAAAGAAGAGGRPEPEMCATLIVAHAVSGCVCPAVSARARGAARAALGALAGASRAGFGALGAAVLPAVLSCVSDML